MQFSGKSPYIEQKELEIIQGKLSLDLTSKQWSAEYPWEENPEVLGNNLDQVKKIMCSTERRHRKSQDTMDKFNGQIKDFWEIKVSRKMTSQEMDAWDGPVHYLPVHEVYQGGEDVTTPVRLVINSALEYQGRSLNSVLMKGPSWLNNLFDVLIRFRSYIVGLIGDISKMYQSIKA